MDNTTPIDPDNENDLQEEALTLWENAKKFLSELFDIRSETDRDSTVEAVRKDIPFKGHNAWILIFSIFVASIGLNVSSTAVVIGAMLISPLMGPIVGAGLSIAINDAKMMKRSFVNLGVMVFLSVTTAFIYFSISPLTEETPELVARTYPTILDVLVAIFGGLALIVAKTKKGTIASAIFGVAIATALMPPLCTVGYGFAVGNLKYAGGAIYLFFINAVFIALSTFVVAKLLRFPLVKYANSKRRKRVAAMATIIAICVLTPSIWLFWNLLQEQIFSSSINRFVETSIDYQGAEVVKATADYEKKRLDVYLIGSLVPEAQIDVWRQELNQLKDMTLAQLVVHQGADQSSQLAERLSSEVKSGILEDLYVKNQEALNNKDERIAFLEDQLTRNSASALPFQSIINEVRINYDGIERFGYAPVITSDFENSDTIPTFKIGWKKSVSTKDKTANQIKLKAWMQTRFKLDTVVIENF